MDSSIKAIFREGQHPQQQQQSRFAVALTLALLVLSALQVALIIVKVLQYPTLNWSVILLPLWLFFSLFCALPCLQRAGNFRIQSNAFLGCMALFWVPFAIFFICLAVKLQTSNTNLRISLFLIPMWIVEGLAILFSVIFLTSGIIR